MFNFDFFLFEIINIHKVFSFFHVFTRSYKKFNNILKLTVFLFKMGFYRHKIFYYDCYLHISSLINKNNKKHDRYLLELA